MRQRLVKRTVNFDAPDTYHLYYGDRTGSPGTILTFFPFADAGPGRAGPGMASAVAYRVPPSGLDAWMVRLAEGAIDFEGPSGRFGERMVALTDPDGLRIELIEVAGPSGAENGATGEPTAGHAGPRRASGPARHRQPRAGGGGELVAAAKLPRPDRGQRARLVVRPGGGRAQWSDRGDERDQLSVVARLRNQ